MSEKKQALHAVLKDELKNNRKVFLVWATLRIFVVAALVLSAIRGYYENVFVCLLVLVLFLMPTFIERRLGIDFPSGLQIVILLHIFAAEILGELACYYVHFPNWDTVLHTVWGFLCAAVGYSLADLLNRDSKVGFTLSPLFLAIVAFCFSMTIGVLWEFFEFVMDRVFLLDMQKDTVLHQISSVLLDETNSNIPIVIDGISTSSINGRELGLGGYMDIGLYDTMEDLFVNFIGAIVFAVIGFFSEKKKLARAITQQFVPRIKDDEDDEPAETLE